MNQRAITLLYHDVISNEGPDTSGFIGPGPNAYKIEKSVFAEHLQHVVQSLRNDVIVPSQIDKQDNYGPPVMLTFDDGGASAYSCIAPMLEEHGFKGIFFITTDYIGKSSFLDEDQIIDLHRRGHVIGSHSCSHPKNISKLNDDELTHEWGESIRILSEILGESVDIASVPGGFYSKRVARYAVNSGVKILFTSEPVQKISHIDACKVVGRFSITNKSPKTAAGEFVSGNLYRRVTQYSYWNLKKIAKRCGGPIYPMLRSAYMTRRS